MKKLVRDKIPEIIKNKWEKCNYYIASEVEYNSELFKKLQEEALEVSETKNKDELVEELADIIEVIKTISNMNNINEKDIEKIRLSKKEKKWWFNKKYILEMKD